MCRVTKVWNRYPWRAVAAALVICLLTACPLAAQAQQPTDSVQVWDAQFRQQTRQRGTIVSHDRSKLVIQLGTGRQLEIPANRVAAIESPWNPRHIAADQAQADGRFEEALALYGQALISEQRGWVRHKLVVQQVWCQRALGRWADAGESFLKVALGSNPSTPYFQVIPLVWKSPSTDPRLLQSAQAWLNDPASDAARLMGASWLLMGENRELAIGVLRELANGSDRDIAFLAETQQWRLTWIRANPAMVESWQQLTLRMPPDLRAGPYHLLGQALARLEQSQQARLAWMRVPIQYPQYRQLASESLLATARNYASDNSQQKADTLYRELVSRYAGTIAAQVAENKLKSSDP
jgi:tetratricopeptide (TPR) repeat protein